MFIFFHLVALQACIDGSMEMVSFLVEHDASVNQADSEGWTPLHVAASCGYPEIAEWVASCLHSMKTQLGKSEIILQQTEVFFDWTCSAHENMEPLNSAQFVILG